MQWTAAINDDRRANSGIVARTPRAHDAAPIRFMIAIDNFEHIVQAYGEPLADRAVGRVRQAIGEWLGEQAELHFESAGIFYGTLHPLEPAPHAAGRSDAGSRINRILINPPVVTLPLGAPISGAPDGGDIYLSISGTWAVQDHTRRCEPAAFEGGCRAPFFGQLAGRGESWAARYRADMSVASAVLGTIRQPSARIALPLAARSMSGAVYRATAADAAARRSEPEQAVAGHLACAWRPVRDARYGQDVLFYEMCPQVVGRDGARRDLADARIALERLGLAATLDRHLVDHALDLLETDPDVALGVQISAQSVSACARWGDVFRRLTGSRTVARRLTIAITETACFPDFAEAVQFVSRLQAFGCAVGIDNFGLGYPVVFALFSLIFFARAGGREILIPLALVATVVFIDVFCVASALAAGPDNFIEIDRNLVFYTSPVAVANSLVFKPKLALSLNLLIIASIGSAALIALLDSASGAGVDLHLLARVVGVVGFYLWFAVAQYIALTLYLRHRRELVEIHHLVAEMERNQRLNEENSRIREDLVRTQRVQMVDSMTSTMAHEVNQPISCANNYIAAARRWLMRSEPDVGEAMISLDGAQGEIVRVSERVMSVRRLMQRLSSEYTSIDLVDLVENAGTIVRRDIVDQGIALDVVWPDDGEDYLIFGCEEELIQVLMNLTANSVDALKSAGASRRITIALAEADLGELELSVSDSGCGIAAPELGRVFDRLYSTKSGGSGLGLPLCKRIVTNHGGTIAMESEPGKGTRVIMRFPRAELRGGGWGLG